MRPISFHRHRPLPPSQAILVALVCAVDIDHLAWYQLLESRALLRLATLHFAAINVASLLPKKAW